MSSWSPQPLLLTKTLRPEKADVMDGLRWVHPITTGRRMEKIGARISQLSIRRWSSRYRDKLAVALRGRFDDRKASWTRNRRIDARCGKTFEDSLRIFRRYYIRFQSLPFLMIVTWNDYEKAPPSSAHPHC